MREDPGVWWVHAVALYFLETGIRTSGGVVKAGSRIEVPARTVQVSEEAESKPKQVFTAVVKHAQASRPHKRASLIPLIAPQARLEVNQYRILKLSSLCIQGRKLPVLYNTRHGCYTRGTSSREGYRLHLHRT